MKVAEDGSFQWTGENDQSPVKVPGSIVKVQKSKVVDEEEITEEEKHLKVPYHFKK